MSFIAGVANAPRSWGVLEFDLEGEYYVQVLDEMAEAGYAGTELGDGGVIPTDSAVLREALESRNFKMLGAFVPVPLGEPDAHRESEETALRMAQLLRDLGGEEAFILISDDNGKNLERTALAGRIGPGQGFSQAQWETAAQTANRIAVSVQEETGLRTALHPHCAGFVETPDEVEMMLAVTHPRLVGLCLDTAHYAYGGGNPLELVRRYGDRIWHVHFKGYHEGVAQEARLNGMTYFEAIERGVFCELAESSLDFGAILEALEWVGYEGWVVVEQDVLPGMGLPLESAKRSRDFLKRLGV